MISLLLAGAAMALAQTTPDAPGVTVTLDGATLMHRSPVTYPAAALQHGVHGTLAVEVKLDSSGDVSDARVLSGPDELRNSVLQSVLQWHFMRDAAGTTRIVQIAFELPGPYRIKSISITGLSDQLRSDLLATLPVHEGDEWTAEMMQRVTQAVTTFDPHLQLQPLYTRTAEGTDTILQISLPIVPALPSRIRIGGNVQSAMSISKVAPVYPAQAKADHVTGTVHLSVIIGKDGMVQELNVMSGPPLLIQAATDAVRQWVYRPTLLNGNPVQVESTVDINFMLNQ